MKLPRAFKSTIKKGQKQGIDNFPLSHYSASAMIKFSTNPLLFKINYLNRDRFETASNISGVIGSAFHIAMQTYYGGTDTLVPTGEQEAIEYGMKAGMDFLEKYNDGFIKFSKGVPNKQKAFDVFSFAFREYIKSKPYDGEGLLAVEEEIVEHIDVEWKGDRLVLPVKLKGKVDIVRRKDGKIKLRDYKTCSKFSDPERIDGAKIIQAVEYYLLSYVKFDEEPYSITFEEVKTTKNADGSAQVREYEIVYAENELYFDFYFRLYEDMTRALNGEMVYVPNINSLYDNEISIISYIHRLDISEETAKLMKKHKVTNVSDLLKRKMQSAGNMRKLLKTVEKNFVSAKNLNYEKMTTQEKIRTKLMEHGMMLEFDSIVEGASVDLYRYQPSIGLKMARLENYVEDVEQVLGITGVRILAPIPHSSLVGFEVPRKTRSFPPLPPSKGFEIAVGQTVMGEVRRFDIREAPHILVAGSAGAGKSVWLIATIRQLLTIPGAELHLFDPKLVELAQFENESRVVEYVSDHKEIATALQRLVEKMEDRYVRMKKAGARNISEIPGMKYKFVVVDEFADLTMRGGVEENIQLLAQKGRACGIHLIIATQRASTQVISGDIKVNFNVRVVFRMAKGVDSRVMIDEEGAEKLLGKGDLLFLGDKGLERLQGYL